jgi:hypothetical protein|tara:strand:+ start:1696 stop:2097 length:402 start_codon:yes stop_codon:yes gene_type:complete
MTTTTEITIECVWCNSRKEFNKFCRNNPGETVIDFYSIRNKLVKSDPYDTEPHRSVIGLAIRDSFINVLNKNADLEKIIYLFKNLDAETIDNFKLFLQETIEPTASLNLTVINRDDYPKGVLKRFESVKIIDL